VGWGLAGCGCGWAGCGFGLVGVGCGIGFDWFWFWLLVCRWIGWGLGVGIGYLRFGLSMVGLVFALRGFYTLSSPPTTPQPARITHRRSDTERLATSLPPSVRPRELLWSRAMKLGGGGVWGVGVWVGVGGWFRFVGWLGGRVSFKMVLGVAGRL